MKKLLIYIMLLLTAAVAIGQEAYFVTFGLDPKLAIKGAYSYDKTPVLDLHFKTGTRLANGIEAGVGAEYANLNPYYLSGKLFINKVFFNPSETFAVAIGAEAVLIQRGRFSNEQKISAVYTYGSNAELRWFVSGSISLNASLGLLHRRDLRLMYNDRVLFKPNGTISITFQTLR